MREGNVSFHLAQQTIQCKCAGVCSRLHRIHRLDGRSIFSIENSRNMPNNFQSLFVVLSTLSNGPLLVAVR